MGGKSVSLSYPHSLPRTNPPGSKVRNIRFFFRKKILIFFFLENRILFEIDTFISAFVRKVMYFYAKEIKENLEFLSKNT